MGRGKVSHKVKAKVKVKVKAKEMIICKWLVISLGWMAVASATDVTSNVEVAAAELGDDERLRPGDLRERYNATFCNLGESVKLFGKLLAALAEGASLCDQDGQSFTPSAAEAVADALEGVLNASEDILRFLYTRALECITILPGEEDPDRFELLRVQPFTDARALLGAEANGQSLNWRRGDKNGGGRVIIYIGQLQSLEGQIEALFKSRLVVIHPMHVPPRLEVKLTDILWDSWCLLRAAWGASSLEMLAPQAIECGEGIFVAEDAGSESSVGPHAQAQDHELENGALRDDAKRELLRLYNTALINASRLASALSESVTDLLESLAAEQGLDQHSYLGLESLVLHATMLHHNLDSRLLKADHRCDRGQRLWEQEEDGKELVTLICGRVLWLQIAAQQQLRNDSFARFGLQVHIVPTFHLVESQMLIRALSNLLEVIRVSHRIDFTRLYIDTEEWPRGPIRDLSVLMGLVRAVQDGLEPLSPLTCTYLLSHPFEMENMVDEELTLPDRLVRRLLRKLLSETQTLAHLLVHFVQWVLNELGAPVLHLHILESVASFLLAAGDFDRVMRAFSINTTDGRDSPSK